MPTLSSGSPKTLVFRRVDTAETWRFAADSKHRYFTALGDASALATAESVDGPSLVGADDDYNITDILVERLRMRLA